MGAAIIVTVISAMLATAANISDQLGLTDRQTGLITVIMAGLTAYRELRPLIGRGNDDDDNGQS